MSRVTSDSERRGPALFLVAPNHKTIATLRAEKDVNGGRLLLFNEHEAQLFGAGALSLDPIGSGQISLHNEKGALLIVTVHRYGFTPVGRV
jgi:hypothetical protein